MKIRILFFVILCLILCLSHSLAQTTWIVPTTAPTIQSAVNSSSPGDTIVITSLYFGEPFYPVHINKPNLTIQGQFGGEIIPGNFIDKIFVITGAGAGCIIQDLQFIQAGPQDLVLFTPFGQAGAIYIMASNNIDIVSCQFFSNAANEGGGICIEGSNTIQVLGCFFGGNNATQDGGGIKANNCHDLVISGCVFDTNIALGNVGGGISIENCANTLVYPYDVHINSCEFYNNTSGLDGGAVSWWQSDGVIDWNTIGDSTDPSQANTSDYGGGISVVNCTTPSLTLIENNDIYNNIASGATPCPNNGGCGGGIFIENSDDSVRVQTNNNVTSNTATFYGGGIALNAFMSPCYPIIQGNTIKYNQVTTQCSGGYRNGGGGICVKNDFAPYSNHPLIDSNNIVENQVLGGSCYGGGILCHLSAPAIQNNSILDNTALDFGGGISIDGDIILYPTRGNIQDNLIKGNYAEQMGGGLYISWDSGPVILDRNRVDHNTAGTSSGIGGGMYLYQSNVAARSNNFTNNQCGDSTGTAVAVDIGCEFYFFNNTVADNDMSVSEGDAMALNSNASLQNNIFSGHPNIYAIKEYDTDQAVTCINNLFWNNGKVYRDFALGERNVIQLDAISGNSGNISGDPLLDSSYHLTTSLSPPYNAGVDLTGFGVIFDIDNEVRPQGGAFEIGSDECLPYTSVKDWFLF